MRPPSALTGPIPGPAPATPRPSAQPGPLHRAPTRTSRARCHQFHASAHPATSPRTALIQRPPSIGGYGRDMSTPQKSRSIRRSHRSLEITVDMRRCDHRLARPRWCCRSDIGGACRDGLKVSGCVTGGRVAAGRAGRLGCGRRHGVCRGCGTRSSAPSCCRCLSTRSVSWRNSSAPCVSPPRRPPGPGCPARRGWLTTRTLLAFLDAGHAGRVGATAVGSGRGQRPWYHLRRGGLRAGSRLQSCPHPGAHHHRPATAVAARRRHRCQNPRTPDGICASRLLRGQGSTSVTGSPLRRASAGSCVPASPAGTPGIITARLPGGLLQVRFGTGETVSAAPGQLVHASQP